MEFEMNSVAAERVNEYTNLPDEVGDRLVLLAVHKVLTVTSEMFSLWFFSFVSAKALAIERFLIAFNLKCGSQIILF